MSRAERAAEEAVAAFAEAGDELGRGEAATRQALARWQFGDSERARAIVQDAIRTLEPLGESVALAGALGELGRIEAIADGPDAVAVLERAVAIAHALGATEIESNALTSIGTAMSHRADPAAAEVIRRGLAIALTQDHIEAAARAYNNLSIALGAADGPQDQIDGVMDAAVAHAARYGYRSGTLAAREISRAAFRLEWDRAIALANETATDTAWDASHSLVGDFIRIYRGGPEATILAHAEQAAQRLRSSSERQFRSMALLLAIIYSGVGAHARAAELAEAEPEVLGTRLGLGGWPNVIVAAVSSSIFALGARERLVRWDEHIAKFAAVADANRLFARALIARAEDRDDDALADLRAVEPAARRRPHFYVRSLAQQHAAELLAGRGDREGAAAAYAAAREPWVTAGATWYLGQLDAWARERGIA